MDPLLPHLPKFLAAYAILVVAASSPGPAVALLLGVANTRGRRAALTVTTGIAAGSVTINLLTLLGLGLLLSQVAWAMTAMRMIGAAYLAWLAIGAFRKALSPPPLAVIRNRIGSQVRMAQVWQMRCCCATGFCKLQGRLRNVAGGVRC